jgi:hypothetical protein
MRQKVLGAVAMVCAIISLAGAPAYADGSVSSIGMGMGARDDAAFQRFEAVVRQYNASGEPFRIDAHCQSACTMFLAIRHVCVSPDATLAFHAGGNRQRGIINPDKSRRMLNTYNAALRRYVVANHFMDTFEFHAISGADIINRFHYRACR